LGEHPASDVAAIVAALRAKIEAMSAGDVASFAHAARAQGRCGFASWLRDAIAEVVQAHPNGPSGGDAASVLAYIRDFAATTAKYVSGDLSTHSPDCQPHAQSIRDHVRALEDHIAANFDS
jgi:hypothetical protein